LNTGRLVYAIHSDASQLGKYDKRVYKALRRVLKSRRKSANDLKPKTLPQLYGSLVRADDEVKLHRPEAGTLRLIFGVDTHRSGDTTTGSMSCRHVSAVAHVGTATALICPKIVGPEYVTIFLSDENLIASREPI
jgi:hypothetical protein